MLPVYSRLQLVRSGRTVIAAVRSAEKAEEVFSAAGLQEGYQQPAQQGTAGGSGGILITAGDVDVTNPATLTAGLFEGVSQVTAVLLCCLLLLVQLHCCAPCCCWSSCAIVLPSATGAAALLCCLHWSGSLGAC